MGVLKFLRCNKKNRSVCVYIRIFSFINLSIQRIYETKIESAGGKKIPYSFDILSYVGFDAFGKIF